MFKKLLFVLLFITGANVFSQDIIKTMFYNLLEFPEALPGDRSTILQNILDEYEPDIFMVCELENQDGADQILNISLNDEGANYTAAPFLFNQSSSSNLQQMLYFRTGMFTLIEQEIITTSVRDINRYLLRVSTTDVQTNPIFLDVYITHLKSSQGSANQNLRLDMVTEFTNKLNTLDPNTFVIFAGDFNIYTSSEPAYQELLDPTNNIVMADPINTPGSWSTNINFQDIHTQSTRISSGPFGAGAGGGMDDRFDFIMISENMLTNPTMRYIPDTYKSFGNNGNCFDNNVSSEDCVGDFSQQLRNNLYSMSDHLPVVMQLETNKDIILATSDFQNNETLIYLTSTIVSEKLELKVAPQISKNISFEIYNTIGQKIISIPPTDSETITIDVSYMSSGIYYIQTNLPYSKPLKFLKTS